MSTEFNFQQRPQNRAEAKAWTEAWKRREKAQREVAKAEAAAARAERKANRTGLAAMVPYWVFFIATELKAEHFKKAFQAAMIGFLFFIGIGVAWEEYNKTPAQREAERILREVQDRRESEQRQRDQQEWERMRPYREEEQAAKRKALWDWITGTTARCQYQMIPQGDGSYKVYSCGTLPE